MRLTKIPTVFSRCRTGQSIDSAGKILRRISHMLLALTIVAVLQGCLLVSPHHAEIYASKETPVTFQIGTASLNPIKLECQQTCRFGPGRCSRGPWTEVTNIAVPATPTSSGVRVVRRNITLPDSCWFAPRPDQFITSVRVSQEDYFNYYTLDAEGQECLGASLSSGVLAWLNNGCYRGSSGNPTETITISAHNN